MNDTNTLTDAEYAEFSALHAQLTALGDEGFETPEGQYIMARMLVVGGAEYVEILDSTWPGHGAEWAAWAPGFIQDFEERRDYPRFFELMQAIRAAIDEHGEEAVHGNPEYAGLFVEVMRAAPPRYRAEADVILKDVMPVATHCDDDGNPLFSAQQIADKFGAPVEEVEKLIAEHLDSGDLYAGPVHAIQ